MKKAALLMFACFGIPLNAAALEDYVGASLDAIRSSENGASNSGGGIGTMISARPDRYYGYEVQARLFGKAGSYSTNAEADFSIAGFLPLADSGIDLYGKAGVDSVYSAGNIFNTGLTYGAGIEYLGHKSGIRLGFQHFNVGNGNLSPTLSTRVIGITYLVKLGK